MIINNNIPALNTYRQMGINQNGAQKAMEKLSSGLRINRAGDDAAGLAISEKMRAQIRGLDQASRNSQDGISLIQTAEGALQETQNILQRMRELATQAANDTNVEIDREEIQKEINQLSSEINRIGNTTEFNTMNLIDGSRSASKAVGEATTKTVVNDQTLAAVSSVGVTTDTGALELKDSSISVDGDFTSGDFAWNAIDDSAANTITFSKNADGELSVVIAATDGTNELNVTDILIPEFDENGEFTYNNHGVSFTITKEAFDAATEDATVEIDLSARKADVPGSELGAISTNNTFTSNDAGATFTDNEIVIDGTRLTSEIPNAANVSVSYDGAGTITVNILDADGNALSADEVAWDGTTPFTYDAHGVSFTVEVADETEGFEIEQELTTGTQTTQQTEDSSLLLQIGANQNQSMAISIEDMRSQALGVTSNTGEATQWVEISRPHQNLIDAGTMVTGDDAVAQGLDGSKYYIQATFTSTSDVTDGTNATGVERALSMENHETAAASVTIINDAIERVSAQRSQLGAFQNRLEHTISNLDNSAENLQAAESRIRDVDMAREVMEMTKNNILSQASQAMLAQANQAPQAVLQLLG